MHTPQPPASTWVDPINPQVDAAAVIVVTTVVVTTAGTIVEGTIVVMIVVVVTEEVVVVIGAEVSVEVVTGEVGTGTDGPDPGQDLDLPTTVTDIKLVCVCGGDCYEVKGQRTNNMKA